MRGIETLARSEMVVAKHTAAAKVGADVLRKGGNAVDAAVATAFALGVVEPYMSGIGGGGLMVIHLGSEDYVIDYTMRSPNKASASMYDLEEGIAPSLFGWRKVRDDANIHGYLSISVPGTVSGLSKAMEKFGRLSLEEVIAPAVRLAEKGVEVNWFTTMLTAGEMDLLVKYEEISKIFLKRGFPYKPGFTYPLEMPEILRQPDLARTMRTIAREGADAFYKGEIAGKIIEDVERNGGILSAQDLSGYQARIERAAPNDYRGFTIHCAKGPSGGPTLVENLNVLEGFDLKAMRHNSPQYLHRVAETGRLSHHDRFKFLADPDFADVPLDRLMSKEYAAQLRSTMSLEKGRESTSLAATTHSSGCTTHLSVVDSARNMVSLTQTLLSLCGSFIVPKSTGVTMNNGMMWFNPQPGTPNSIEPNKRPLSNMAPILVTKDGKPVMSLGAPGGRRIINAVTQVAINVLDFSMRMQEAIDAPRIHCEADELLTSENIPRRTIRKLRKMGHKVVPLEMSPGSFNFASPVGILVDQKSNLLRGGFDPYRPGLAIGR